MTEEEAGLFPLFPVLLCDRGYWDYSASQYMSSSLGFECLPLAVTVILFTSDFRDCLQYSKQKSLFYTGGERGKMLLQGENREMLKCFSHGLFTPLFHL